MAGESNHTEVWRHLNEKVIDTSNLFLRSAILINGGAAIAVLGFVASIAKADQSYSDVIVGVAGAIAFFAYGATAAVAGIALAYLTNYAALATYNNIGRRWERALAWVKRIVHVFALVAAVSSLLLFLKGTLAVKAAILSGVV